MKKYLVDTNFVLRYLLADHEEHYNQTKLIFEQARDGKCQIEIEQSVFTEIIFVLSSFYKVPKPEIVSILKSLFLYKGIKVERELLLKALDIYLESNIHIVDAIIAAKVFLQESYSLCTFDKKLLGIIDRR